MSTAVAANRSLDRMTKTTAPDPAEHIQHKNVVGDSRREYTGGFGEAVALQRKMTSARIFVTTAVTLVASKSSNGRK